MTKKLDKEQIEISFEEAFEKYAQNVDKIISKIREKLIIPFCEKHDLVFLSGNGNWFFCAKKNPDDYEYSDTLDEAHEYSGWSDRPLGYLEGELESSKQYPCQRLLRILETIPPGFDRNDIGSLMAKYRPKKGVK